MADSFSSFSKTWQSPYTRAVSLTPAMGEFEPTRAVIIQSGGILTCLFADSTVNVSLRVGSAYGLIEMERMYRIKRVISFVDKDGANLFATDPNAIIGLY